MKYIDSGGNQQTPVISSATASSKSSIHHSHFSTYIGSLGVIYIAYVTINIESCYFQNCQGYLPFYDINSPKEKSVFKKCIISNDQNTNNAILEDCSKYNGESTFFPMCSKVMINSVEYCKNFHAIICTLGIIN